ncbi:hypothetical protein QUB13_24835 [Microcoleus sp. B4-D4]
MARSLFHPNPKSRSPIIHQTSDRPSCIRVNLRPSAVKKELDPFLTIQKGSRPFYNHEGRSISQYSRTQNPTSMNYVIR